MARPRSRHPTDLELEILKILWRNGPCPVRTVRDELAGFRKLALTSVTTVMNIMTEKGYLRRSKQGPSFLYRARVTERTTTRKMLNDLIERVFDGSPASVMVNLLETADIGDDELAEIKKIINQKAKERTE